MSAASAIPTPPVPPSPATTPGANTSSSPTASTSANFGNSNSSISTTSSSFNPANPDATPDTKTANSKNPKNNKGLLIAIFAALGVIVIALVTTLIIVLVNNNSPKTASGNNHYEDNGDNNSSGSGSSNNTGGNSNPGSSSSGSTIACLGYSFNKLSGYTFECGDQVLTVTNSTYALALSAGDGNYANFRAYPSESALAVAESLGDTAKRYTIWTASNDIEMIIFELDSYDGKNYYGFITRASSDEVFVGAAMNKSGVANINDLEKAAAIIAASNSSASRLPDDAEAEESDNDSLDALQNLDFNIIDIDFED